MNQPIFVTGGCGFIGSNMVYNLIRSGYRVVNIDVMAYAASHLTLAPLLNHDLYKLICASICDGDLLLKLLYEFKPRAILNFAAQTHVDRSIDAPEAFIETNIVGTFRLLESTKIYLASLPETEQQEFRLVHISTDEVFGSIEFGVHSESDPQNPSSPYAASKAAAANLAMAWYTTYNLPIIITNCTNNYGPYQFPEKLIPKLIISALHGQDLPIYGDGLHSRNWLFVDDHIAALRRVIEIGYPGQAYNIAGKTEITNIDLALQLCAVLDRLAPRLDGESYAKAISFVSDRPGHDRRYALSSKKIENELSWFPLTNFQDGLEKTVSWYLDNRTWWQAILKESYNLERLGLNRR